MKYNILFFIISIELHNIFLLYTHRHTHTHTPRPILQVLFFCENAETRLKKLHMGPKTHTFYDLQPYTCSQEMFNLTSIHDTCYRRCVQRDVRPQQCIPLLFGNDCDHTILVFSMFTLSVTEMDSQPNVSSHYGQVYISQKVCIFGPMFIRFLWLLPPLKILHFLTLCIQYVDLDYLSEGQSHQIGSQQKEGRANDHILKENSKEVRECIYCT